MFYFQYFLFLLSLRSCYYCNDLSLFFISCLCQEWPLIGRRWDLGKLLSRNRFLHFAVKIRENSQKSYWSTISYAHAPGYYLTFISFALFDLSNIRFPKKLIFTCCSVLTHFCHYLHLPLDLFLFEFFWSRNFWEKLLQ
jgi:hypothetical protein